ncbi:molybdopterin synthase catalytic subunit MoaE [Marinimicrobium agarilyticum]|uniref:molybdopterin synthase catalytic subunit MoaE n=1 Tax=Marinimicrobium agarilyticum TaxID=306546 RepID=UPI00041BE7FA|nr:molybdopterin synthase catalytic subunit MoaE [Marinimicrobium agarilyticum]
MISVQREPFDVAHEYKQLTGGDVESGAAVFFVGRVRARNDGRRVSGLSLEHYPGMTEKALEAIVSDARERWPLERVRVIHRVGPMALGEEIVFVGVTSSHRDASFQAAEFIMDYLKNRAPFWKQEQTEEGPTWVEAKAKDHEALGRWQ